MDLDGQILHREITTERPLHILGIHSGHYRSRHNFHHIPRLLRRAKRGQMYAPGVLHLPIPHVRGTRHRGSPRLRFQGTSGRQSEARDEAHHRKIRSQRSGRPNHLGVG